MAVGDVKTVRTIDNVFPEEKVLTISAETYLSRFAERDPDEYKAVGVHAEGCNLRGFRAKVPRKAEVVVDYRCSLAYDHLTGTQTTAHSGTALAPQD